MLRGEHLRLQEYDRKTEEQSDVYLGFHSVLPAVRFCYPALSDLQVSMTGIGLSRRGLGAEKVRGDFHITERTLWNDCRRQFWPYSDYTVPVP